MNNRKGFVMTETLVVTVFLVTIFTFIYVSIVPLLGKYEDKSDRDSNIDIVYKLYNIRKMIKNDSNRATITSSSFKRITCSDLSDSTYCNKMMQFLELSNYFLAYTNNIESNLNNFYVLNVEMHDYISRYRTVNDSVLVLIDTNKHTVAHLAFN